MSSRLGRALRGVSLACLCLAAALAAPPVLAQSLVVHEGVAPPGSVGASALAAGWHHSCVLQADGSVVCWGNNDNGQSSPPPGARFIAISAGWFDTCGVRDDGSLLCWGHKPELQQVPAGKYTSVALNDDGAACALRDDGRAVCWGGGYYGQQPPGTYLALSGSGDLSCGLRADRGVECWRAETASWPVAAPGGPYRGVAAGGDQVCGLPDAGGVECWNASDNSPREGRSGIYVALTASNGGVCALDADGHLQCWGYAEYVPQPPQDGFTTLIAGNSHACAIRGDGTVACWGGNYFGESDPPPGAATVQVVAEGVATSGGRVRALASGEFHTCALLDDASVSCWGDNYAGQSSAPEGRQFAAIGAGGFRTCGVRVDGEVECWGDSAAAPLPGPFVSVAVGFQHTCALREDGRASCWGGSWQPTGRYLLLSADGDVTCGVRYDGIVECWKPWGEPQLLSQDPATSIGMSGNQRCVVQQGGDVRCWNIYDDYEREGRVGGFAAVSAAGNATCALRLDGTTDCWGDMWNWPAPPAGGFAALSAGFDHFCGIRTDGTVACWGGHDGAGQLTPPRALSMPPGIAAGGHHTCAVRADGQVDCWGDNVAGQASPVPGTYVTVGAGDKHSCALQEDGLIRCWGANAEGQLDAPTEPMAQMSVGRLHGCALTMDGQARCWGLDNFGQATPPGGTVFDAIGAGFAHSCGVVRDGPGLCWGYDGDGQTWVPALPWEQRWLTIQAGERHSCGLVSDGTIQCWGSDSDGQSWPVPTGYFRALSVGAFHNCAIRTDGRLACWGANWAGQTNAPEGSFVSVSAGANHTCAIAVGGARQCWGDNGQGQAPRREVVPPELSWAIRYGEPTQIRLLLLADDYENPELPGQFRLVAGALPTGLSLSSDGDLTGTPTLAGTYDFTVSGIDADGFGASRSYQVTVDSTPPLVHAFYSWPNTKVNGWYTSNIEVSWWVEDPETSAWPVSGCQRTLFNSDTTGTIIACTGQSGGGTATSSVTIRRDATPPETKLTSGPASRTNRTDAQFEFAGADATSGLAGFECSLDGAAFAACSSPYGVFVSASGGSHTMQIRAVDHAGHRDPTPATHSWQVDTSAPTIAPTVTGTQGTNGWYVGDVQVTWTVADAESGIVSATGCNAVALTSDTPGAGFTCTATNAAGTTISRTVMVKRDATAPAIVAAATTAANAAGWYRGDVEVVFSCSDVLSGVAACPSSQVLGGEGTAITSAARTITDAAGNSATSNTVAVMIDRTAPALAPVVSPATLLVNAAGTAAANGADGLSGIASESCHALATATPGSKSVACTVADRAGNTASSSAGYRVVYGFVGFNAPVQNPPVLNTSKAGRSIPLRWRVIDANGAPVSDLTAASVGAVAVACPSASEHRITTYGGSNGQLQNLGNGYYQLDWMAPTSLRGTCRRLELNLGDGDIHPAQFKFN